MLALFTDLHQPESVVRGTDTERKSDAFIDPVFKGNLFPVFKLTQSRREVLKGSPTTARHGENFGRLIF